MFDVYKSQMYLKYSAKIMIFFFFFFQVRHLCGLAVFESYLYTVNSDNLNILRVNRYNGTDVQSLARLDNAKEIHVYQKRTQTAGKIKIPLSRKRKTRY